MKPTTINNRYVLQEQLGAGGMGVVHLAYDRLTQETVALKQVQIPPERLAFMSRAADDTTQTLRLSLAHEFQTLASLRHPHIISVLDYGFATDQQPFYTMNYLSEAQTILAAAQHLPLREKIAFVEQLLQALAYLHRRGVLHRDLKPENVLVTQGQVRVLDFGLASRRDDATTGSSGGSAAYMAPELWQGQQPQEATDLYAVGIILFELLAGQHPFAPLDASLIYRVLQKQPDLSLLGVDRRLADVVGRLLVKDPDRRLNRVTDVLWVLSEALGEPVPVETQAIRESYLQAAAFVGREQEMSQLTQALEQAQQGQGSIWLVGGESGVGKSRVLDELRTQALVSGWQVITGQAVAEGGAPYQLWRDVVPYLALGIELTDLEAGVLLQLAPQLGRLLERPITEPPPLAGAAAYQRLLLTLTNILQRQTQPTLLLLEDLQWSAESLEPLIFIERVIGQTRLLIVGSYRHDERPGLPEVLPQANVLGLNRFNEAAIRELSSSMLGTREQAQEDMIALLQKETEGNVFFLVEVVRALAEEAGQLAAIGQTSLPQAVFTGGMQRLIRRRLAQVPRIYQPLLQQAAIIGREIDPKVLAALDTQIDLPTWLGACQEAAVLAVQANRWRFAHDKLREAVLADLPETERPVLYGQVAATIETVYPDDGRAAANLAQLWQVAENQTKALHFAVQAGHYAAAQYANQEAIRFFNQAYTFISEHTPQQQFELLLAREDVYHLIGERTAQKEDLDALLNLAKAQDRTAWRVTAALRYARYGKIIGNYDAATQAAQDALHYAQLRQNDNEIAECYLAWGSNLEKAGDFNTARQQLQQSIKMFRQSGDQQREANALTNLGSVAYRQGDYAESQQYILQSLELHRANGQRMSEAAALMGLGNVALGTGDYAAAWVYLDQCITIDRDIGNRVGEAAALGNLGYVAYKQGVYDQAEGYLKESLSLSRQLAYRMGEITALGNLGLVCYEQGAYAESRNYYEQAIVHSQQINERYGEVLGSSFLGRTLWHLGLYEEAQENFQTCLTICREIGTKPEEANCLYFWGLLAFSQQAYEEAQAYWQQALAIHQELQQPYAAAADQAGLIRVAMALGQPFTAHLNTVLDYVAEYPELNGADQPMRIYLSCYQALHHLSDVRADAVLTQGFNILEAAASKITNPEARRSFLENVPEHREVMMLYQMRT